MLASLLPARRALRIDAILTVRDGANSRSDGVMQCYWGQPLPHGRGSDQSPERQRAGLR